MSKIHNLTGRAFGRLRVVKRSGSICGRAAWHCICCCGREMVVTGNALLSGNTTSCGCGRIDTLRSMQQPLAQRFAQKLARPNKRGCVLWVGAVGANGYGLIGDGDRTLTASRVAYELANGPIKNGAHVLHRCDNPLCCNPKHLYLGGNRENTRDRVVRGRGASKLTATQVRAIRARLARGDRQSMIAQRFGVSQAQVSNINTGKHWKAA